MEDHDAVHLCLADALAEESPRDNEPSDVLAEGHTSDDTPVDSLTSDDTCDDASAEHLASDDQPAGALTAGPASDDKTNNDTTLLSAVISELLVLGKLALPITTTFLMQSGLDLICVTAAGHLGVAELDGVGLGRFLSNCTGLAPLLGLIMALDTLATQAHGATKLTLVGTLAQRASLIALVACIPIFAFWWNMEGILLRLGQDPEVVPKAMQFLHWITPGAYPFVVFEITKKYLQAQNIVYPIPVILVTTLAFHAAATYVLIWPCQLGFIGCPLAISLSYTFMMTLSLLYVRFSAKCLPCCTPVNPMQCWGGWSRDAFRQWCTFLRIGVPSAILFCLDWWSFELLMLMSGILGMTQLASANIIMQLILFTFMPPLGIAVAAAVRVGQRLGAGDPSGARLTAWTAIAVVVIEVTFNALFVFGILNIWARMFTDDAAVLELIHRLPLLVAGLVWVDGMQGGIVGVLRGAGLQAWGLGINFVSQWLVGIPLAIFAAFYWGWGLSGLYSGQLLGCTLVSTLFTIIISCINWPKMAKAARHRAGCHSSHSMSRLKVIMIDCPAKTSEVVNIASSQ